MDHPLMIAKYLCKLLCKLHHLKNKTECYQCGYTCSLCESGSRWVLYTYPCPQCSQTFCISHIQQHYILNAKGLYYYPYKQCTQTRVELSSSSASELIHASKIIKHIKGNFIKIVAKQSITAIWKALKRNSSLGN